MKSDAYNSDAVFYTGVPADGAVTLYSLNKFAVRLALPLYFETSEGMVSI